MTNPQFSYLPLSWPIIVFLLSVEVCKPRKICAKGKKTEGGKSRANLEDQVVTAFAE